MLGIRYDGYAGTAGDYYGIGIGFLFQTNEKYCCEIGVIITNNYDREYGDLIFSTRNTTGRYDVAIEIMWLTSTRNFALGSNIDKTT